MLHVAALLTTAAGKYAGKGNSLGTAHPSLPSTHCELPRVSRTRLSGLQGLPAGSPSPARDIEPELEIFEDAEPHRSPLQPKEASPVQQAPLSKSMRKMNKMARMARNVRGTPAAVVD